MPLLDELEAQQCDVPIINIQLDEELAPDEPLHHIEDGGYILNVVELEVRLTQQACQHLERYDILN